MILVKYYFEGVMETGKIINNTGTLHHITCTWPCTVPNACPGV